MDRRFPVLAKTRRLARAALLGSAALVAWPLTGAGAPVDGPVHNTTWVTDGTVYAIAASGRTVYIGGDFTRLSPATGGGVLMHPGKNEPLEMPQIHGDVVAVESDGAGGWYVAGDFQRVGHEPRSSLAHIDAEHRLTDWNPTGLTRVTALAVGDGVVYVAGQCWRSGSGIFGLDARSGERTDWRVEPAYANAMAVSGGNVYVGGRFTTIAGVARKSLAAFDAVTGTPTEWNPATDDWVFALCVDGGTVYVGGRFRTAGGQPRRSLAAIDAETGAATDWDPGPPPLSVGNSSVDIKTIAVSGETVYVGGQFPEMGGKPRNNIAALDAGTGLATDWAPGECVGKVEALVVTPGIVYVGGRFSCIGNRARMFLAGIDAATGEATEWDPRPNFWVMKMAGDGEKLFVGGRFSGMGGVTRWRIAALDAATGRPTDWNPRADGPVLSLAAEGNTVYAGGWFTHIGGLIRVRLAALDAETGTATSWNPSSDGAVKVITAHGNTVWLSGPFGRVGGQNRAGVAAIDAETGRATSWAPLVEGGRNPIVRTLAVGEGTVYVGGDFTHVGGQPRASVAATDAVTGLPTAWDASASRFNTVRALVIRGDTIYAGGDRIAALDASTGNVGPWFSYGLGATALVVEDGRVYTGRLVLDAETGEETGWAPGGYLAGPVPSGQTGEALGHANRHLFVGGAFRGGLARFELGTRRASPDQRRTASLVAAPGPRPGPSLAGPRPNPARGPVWIDLTLPQAGPARLDVLDVRGRLVHRLVDGALPAGHSSWRWDGSGPRGPVPSGVYYVRARAADRNVTERVVIIR